MDFGLSAEQVQLQDQLNRFLGGRVGLERTRAFAAHEEARAADVVQGLGELGVLGLIVPAEHGGAGLGLLDAALVSERLGAHVAPAPFIGAAVLAPLALCRRGSEMQKSLWLPRIAAGDSIFGVALPDASARSDGVEARSGKLFGRATFVIDYEADAFIVADRRGGLHLLPADAPGLARRRLKTIDVTRPTGELIFDGASAEPLGEAGEIGFLIDAGRLLFAADTLGAAQTMLDRAVDYAKAREQFGRPIGAFQAVKHMCAEMAAALEPCRALIWYAGHALDELPVEGSLTAAHAKAHLGEIGAFVAKTATEVHGGMGFTDLLGLHYWFKRIGFNRQMLGGPQATREAAARLSLA